MKMTQVFSGSIARDSCVELRERLKKHLDQIVQPQADAPEDEHRLSPALREIQELARSGDFALYSDDALFRIWCLRSEGNPGGLCTLDLLCGLEEVGQLDRGQVASKIAQLCSWHVGIQILLRHQIAAVPEEVARAADVNSGVGLLHADPTFMAIANGMWGPRSDFFGGLQHVGNVIRLLVKQPDIPPI
jgi:hypothetical protein